MAIKKYHVQCLWEKEEGTALAPIYAADEKQAAQIAIEHLKDKRRDYSEMRGIRTKVTAFDKSKERP